ncbi:MAG: class D sortase [Actinobacteria bacterium]|nr:class D sortase [Actinomycetota bacterium]MCG2808660.1 class D sortase [Coriobacteriia bacterium]
MPRARPSHGTRSYLGTASLGLVILGIALVGWALFNIIGSSSGDPTASLRPIKVSGDSPTVSVNASDVLGPWQPNYPENPAVGEVLGMLSFPTLGQTFDVIEGTGDEELKRGVGHMLDTAMPGEPDNCVISGHRDTVFSDLGKLDRGDQIILQTAAGTFAYEIGQIRIVDKDDLTVVVPADHAVLSISTCYPFNYVGSAPKRYVLVANLVGS